MRIELIRDYVNVQVLKKYNIDVNKITSENVFDILNSSNTRFIYESEFITINGNTIIKVCFYAPQTYSEGFASIDCNSDTDVLGKVREALLEAVRNAYINTGIKTPEVSNQNKAASNETDKETIDSIIDEQILNPIPISNENKNDSKNLNGGAESNKLREDQIRFVKNFKEKYCSNKAEALNIYVRTWADRTSYKLKDKNDLIKAGSKVVDEFIAWIVEEIINKKNSYVYDNKESVSNNEFISAI